MPAGFILFIYTVFIGGKGERRRERVSKRDSIE